MSEDFTQQVDECRNKLESLQSSLPIPEMITDSDRGEFYLRVNPSAYIALSIEALKAAQGKSIQTWRMDWIQTENWKFAGLIVASSITQSARRRASFRWKWNRGTVVMYLVIATICLLLAVGLFTVGHWLFVLATRGQ